MRISILLFVLYCASLYLCFSQKVVNPTVRKQYPKVQQKTVKTTSYQSSSRRQLVPSEGTATVEEAQSYTPSYQLEGKDYDLIKKYNRLIQLFTLLKKQMDTTVSILNYYRSQSANQSELELAKKEVIYWQNRSNVLTAQYIKPVDNVMKIKLVDSKIEFKVVSVTGNPKEQTVTITFVITNNKAHQMVRLNNPYDGKVRSVAYDGYGNSFYIKSVQIGDKTEQDFLQDLLLTGVPRTGYLVIRNVLPSVESFKYVLINWLNYNYDGGENEKHGQVELKNVRINWKK